MKEVDQKEERKQEENIDNNKNTFYKKTFQSRSTVQMYLMGKKTPINKTWNYVIRSV